MIKTITNSYLSTSFYKKSVKNAKIDNKSTFISSLNPSFKRISNIELDYTKFSAIFYSELPTFEEVTQKCIDNDKSTYELLNELKDNFIEISESDKYKKTRGVMDPISERTYYCDTTIRFLEQITDVALVDEFLSTGDNSTALNSIHTRAKNFFKLKNMYNFWTTPIYEFEEVCRCFAYFHNKLLNSKKLKQIENLKNRDFNISAQVTLLTKIQNAKGKLSINYIKPINIIKSGKDENIEINNNMQNSIMIEHSNKATRENIINWLLQCVPCNKFVITGNKNLSFSAFAWKLTSALDEGKSRYETTKIPSLIYVEDMEKFVSKDLSRKDKAKIKSLLQGCFEKYHTTLLFETANSEQIDVIAKQPHRILHINVEKDPIIDKNRN